MTAKKPRWERPDGDPPKKVSDALAKVAETKNLIFQGLMPITERLDNLESAMKTLFDLVRSITEERRSVSARPDGAKTSKNDDNVNHPSHYTTGGIEVIDAIEAWGLGFNPGNAVKYLARAGKKDPAKHLEDLAKAAWYVQREIERVSGK